MNNLNKINCLLLISITLLFSCGSSKSFSDRHYNKRYYIGMSDRADTEKKDEVKNEINAETLTPADEYLAAEPVVSQASIGEGLDVVKEQETNVATDPDSKEEVTDSPKENFIERSPWSNQPDRFADERGAEKKDTFSEIKERAAHSSGEDEALSLLWIVIVVLLILWALGYIVGGVGTGGLIHLLLVIALILLILWLLRIL